MKVVRIGKRYTNYGLIPQNEYADTNWGKSTPATAVMALDPKSDAVAYKQRLSTQQALHPSGRKHIRGWAQSWKVNGWRAEAALEDADLTGMSRYSDDVRKNDHPL